MNPIRRPRLARNAALNLLGQALPLLAALPAIPLLIAGAGAERFGLLAIAWAVIGYVGVLDLGVSRALTWTVASRVGEGRKHELPALVRAGVRIALLIGIGVGVAVLLAGPVFARLLTEAGPLRGEALLAIRLVALAVPFVILTGVLRGVLEGLHRFGTVNLIRIPMGVATFLAPVAILPWTHDLGALVGALLLARLMGWVGYGWGVRRALSLEDGSPEPASPSRNLSPGGSAVDGQSSSGSPPSSEARRLLRYGGWATVSNVVGPLMVSFDRVAVGALLGAAAVAFYTTPFEVVHRLLIVPSAVVAVFFPAFAQAAGRTSALFRGSVEGVLLLLLPPALLLFAFAPEGLTLWVGEDFSRAGSGVARWLIVGMMINAVAHVPFALIQGVGRPRVTGLLHLMELPLYGAALLWVLPRWGIEGAAVVWVGRAILDLLLMLKAAGAVVPGATKEARRALVFTLVGAALMLLTLPMTSLGVRAGWVALVTLTALVLGWRRVEGWREERRRV